MKQLHEPRRTVAQLRGVVRALLRSGYPKLEQIAEEVGLTQRTLQRRLATAGTSYSELVSEVRCELAEELLRDRGVPIASIAKDVGFANHSGFSRAFLRRNGMTPRQFRSQTDTTFRKASAPVVEMRVPKA